MRSALEKFKVVLDTKPLIKLFAQEEGWKAVQEILFRIEAGELEAGISVVTLTEVYYKYLLEKRPDLAVARADQLRYATYLKKLVITEDAAIKAGELRGRYGIPVADAYIAASAYLEGSVVVSDDPDFRKIHEIKALTATELCHKLRVNDDLSDNRSPHQR
ncbi:TPA: PIN domain-containing protein [Candidatus Bathyarchaeota archaeon]|nr:PIN domain-containing protein [Candidatus Bathyarchaeota archaeon]